MKTYPIARRRLNVLIFGGVIAGGVWIAVDEHVDNDARDILKRHPAGGMAACRTRYGSDTCLAAARTLVEQRIATFAKTCAKRDNVFQLAVNEQSTFVDVARACQEEEPSK